MHIRNFVAPVAALAILAACSDDSSGPSHVPTSMTITFDTLDFGRTVEAALVVNDQNGVPMDVASLPDAIVLESSDTTVATVSSDDLTLTATGIGEAEITAHYGELEASGTLPVRVGAKPPQRLVAGDYHNCLINDAGPTVCWGSNDQGTLGSGDAEGPDTGVPVVVAGNHQFSTLTAGYHTCALEDGSAWCWGEGDEGALGNGADTNTAAPVKVAGGHTFTQISSGWGHVCALTADGQAYCWGYNKDGEVGNGTTGDNELEPVAVSGGLRFAQLVASGDHTCGLTRLGKTYCLGYGNDGVLGTGDGESQPAPVEVLDTLTFVTISGGYYHECGLERTGRVLCWGDNEDGQSGIGTTDEIVYEPRAVDSEVRFASIGSATEDHTCAVERDTNDLYCWGYGEDGQLGDGGGSSQLSPVPVPGFQAKLVSAGQSHSCAIDTSDDVYCWGRNTFGEVGNGSLAEDADPPVLSPSQVHGLDGVAALRMPGSMVSTTTRDIQTRHHHRR
jgi:alpha-tubulin suppressor-like RCC1 family protein